MQQAAKTRKGLGLFIERSSLAESLVSANVSFFGEEEVPA